MNKQELINEIEKTATEANCTEIEIISAMQTACAAAGEEATLEMLCDIKWDYITV